MNKNTRIVVQTPVGLTSECEVGETLGQRTVEGAVASAVSLDNGVRDFFDDSEDEVYYHGIKLNPFLFQDDVARLSLDVSSAQTGNHRMSAVAGTKLLNFNLEKSCCIVFGSKQRRQEIVKEWEKEPLVLYNKIMEQKMHAKYFLTWIWSKLKNLSTVHHRRFVVSESQGRVKCIKVFGSV